MPTGHHRKLRVKNHTLKGGVLPGADISAPYKCAICAHLSACCVKIMLDKGELMVYNRHNLIKKPWKRE